MFKQNENYEVDNKILKCDYIRHWPAETSKLSTSNSQIDINIPREVSLISLLDSYLQIIFEVIKKADNSGYGDGNDKTLVNLGRIALFRFFKLTTSSGMHLAEFTQAHIVFLMYKL